MNNKWYQNGKLHRENGPAVELEDGTKEYWLNVIKVTQEKFNQKINHKI